MSRTETARAKVVVVSLDSSPSSPGCCVWPSSFFVSPRLERSLLGESLLGALSSFSADGSSSAAPICHRSTTNEKNQMKGGVAEAVKHKGIAQTGLAVALA